MQTNLVNRILASALAAILCSCGVSTQQQPVGKEQGKLGTSTDVRKNTSTQTADLTEDSDTEEDLDIETEAKEPVKKYDAKNFSVVNIRAQVLRLDKSLSDSVEFEVLGGKVDFVSFELCPLEVTDQECKDDANNRLVCDQWGGCIMCPVKPVKATVPMTDDECRAKKGVPTPEKDGSKTSCMLPPMTDDECRAKRTLPTCGRGGQCATGMANHNRIVFPPLYAGKSSLKITPCLLPEHSLTSERCGKGDKITFDTHRPNDAVLKLWNDKERALDDIVFYEKQRFDAYGEFEKHAQDCIKQHAKGEAELRKKAAIVAQIRALMPWNVAGAGLRAFWDNTFANVPYMDVSLEKISWAMDKVSDKFDEGMEEACKTDAMSKACEYGKIANEHISKYVGTPLKGMKDGMNPVHSLSNLSSAIQTLMDPEAQVVRDCNAEDTLHKAMGVIDDQVETKKAELKRAVDALRKAGLVQ